MREKEEPRWPLVLQGTHTFLCQIHPRDLSTATLGLSKRSAFQTLRDPSENGSLCWPDTYGSFCQRTHLPLLNLLTHWLFLLSLPCWFLFLTLNSKSAPALGFFSLRTSDGGAWDLAWCMGRRPFKKIKTWVLNFHTFSSQICSAPESAWMEVWGLLPTSNKRPSKIFLNLNEIHCSRE